MPEIAYLFRYRDLVADSLEHRAVLDSQEFCWWGWWKRPNEPAHSDIWRDPENGRKAKNRFISGCFTPVQARCTSQR